MTARTSVAAPPPWVLFPAVAAKTCAWASASLLGANSGLGISLVGDDCIVEAGLYVTASTKVTVLGSAVAWLPAVPAIFRNPRLWPHAEEAGMNNILYRRNSLNGAVPSRAREPPGQSSIASCTATKR